MWYPFACSICEKRVPDHWTPECCVCPDGTRHVLCEEHHWMLYGAGIIKNFKVERDRDGNILDVRHGWIRLCPTPGLVLSLRLMGKV